VDLYFFDFDKTLYAYNFRYRLPALAEFTGASQYHLASTWWAGGFEARAEAGEWATADEYLAEFARVTGVSLSLGQWTDARKLAMTRIDGSVAALRRAAGLGRVSLFSNNPAPLGETLGVLAPEVAEILGDNVVISYQIGVRKPDQLAFERALARYGAVASETFLADDNPANIEAGLAAGITAHHFTSVPLLDAAITEFAERAR
jgi:glucose-1-phosphatase